MWPDRTPRGAFPMTTVRWTDESRFETCGTIILCCPHEYVTYTYHTVALAQWILSCPLPLILFTTSRLSNPMGSDSGPKMKRKIIFVDIDGVLLPFPPTTTINNNNNDDGRPPPLFPSHTLEPLQRLWRHVTQNGRIHGDVEWVLSSTWRVQWSYIRDIERALSDFGIPLEFSDRTDPLVHTERQWEIYAWLEHQNLGKGNKSLSVWLALDDEELLKEDKNAKHRAFFENHVVFTESHIGLSAANVDKAIKLWDQQTHNASVDSK